MRQPLESTELPARSRFQQEPDPPAIVLEGLTVRRVGPRGNRDGIKLSGVTDFRVESCRVERFDLHCRR